MGADMNQSRRWIVSAYLFCTTLVGALGLEYYGLNASSDSLKYLNAGASWNQLLELNGVWPPGYPGLIWMLSSFGLSTVMAASVLSSLAISVALYALFDLGKSYVRSSIYGILSAAILFLYTDLHTIALTVLTEGVFCGILILFCTQLWHWLHKPSTNTLYILTVLTGLACLTRYAGYILVPPLFYAVWIRRKDVAWKNWGIVLILSFSPLIAWLIRNVNRYGQLHGSRQPAKVSWSENIALFWDTVSINLLAGGLLTLFALCSLGLIQKWRNGTDQEKSTWTWVYILWGIIGLQAFLTLYSSSTVLLDPINTRLTAGIYCILISLSIVGAPQITHWLSRIHPNICMGALLLSIVAAQSLSNPDRESKERQRDFIAKYTSHSFLNLFGFNQSNTAQELRTYFENKLVKSKTPVHIMWFEQSKANQKFQLLHHRDFLFNDRLKRISVTSNLEQVRFALTADGENRSLIVHNITQAKNKSRLQTRVQDSMMQTKQSNTTLIGRKPMLKNWDALNMEWTSNAINFKCGLVQNALQYAIVECNMETIKPIDSEDTVQITDAAKLIPKSDATQTEETINSNESTHLPNSTDLKNHLYLSEVMQVPLKVAKFRGEWIELYNPTDAIIDLSTYSVHSKGDKGISFTAEHSIQPKSAFLMAVRKSPSGNGGLPTIDFLYNHDVLKITATDWIELRKGTEVVDRWSIDRDAIKAGHSLQRSDNGTFCHATQTYGDGDYGSPRKRHSCPETLDSSK